VRRFVRPDKLFVVHNGVQLEAFADRRPDGAGLRTEVDVPKDAAIVMNVSHVCPRKGQEYLLDVTERMYQSVPEAHLCLVGSLDRDQAYVRRLHEEASRRGLLSRVHLLGFRTDVPRLLREASVYVHSAIADPHPRAVIEAMAAGLPVVAFAVDGVAETVENGVTGWLVDCGDTEALASAVVKLVRCPPVGRRMGELGRARVYEHFTAGATADRVRAIIEGVLVGAREDRP
jgi:glycosyltransferase involved in cell wall biosynthesis